MALVDLQILVKGRENTSYEARRFLWNQFASQQILCHPKLLLTGKFYERFIKIIY